LKSEAKNDLLAILRNVIFFVAIYLYFIGWTYAYYLYSHFGVSLYSLDIPVYYFFIYSYAVIYSHKWWVMLLLGGFFIIVIALRSRKELRKLVAISFLLVFFPVSFGIAKTTAFESALLLRKGYGQTINLVFREAQKETLKGNSESNTAPEIEKQSNIKNYPEVIIKANEEGELRLLTQTKDKFYVLYQPKEENGELPMCYTYVISATDISLATIEAQNTPNIEIEVQNIPR